MTQPVAATSITSPNLYPYLFSFIVAELSKQGVSKRALLQRVDLTVAELDNEHLRWSYQQGLALIKNSLVLSANPALGLTIGATQPVTTWGLLAYSVSTSKNLLEALNLGIRYQLISTQLGSSSLQVQQDKVIFQTETPYVVGELLPFIIEEIFAANVSLGRQLLSPKANPLAIYLSYKRPSYADAYQKYFRCPVYYNQPVNQLVLDKDLLQAPLASHNLATQKMAQRLCEELFQQQRHQHDIIYEVRSLLLKSPGKFPSMVVVAQQLGVSERSLRRQLTKKNTSFQKIYDEVREKIASEFLTMSSLPLADIAFLVGFSELGAFTRAFKKWTGKSPTTYRVESTIGSA